MTPDVNVLVAASRQDHPHHAVAHAWLKTALVNSGAKQPLAILPMVASGFFALGDTSQGIPGTNTADGSTGIFACNSGFAGCLFAFLGRRVARD